MPRPEDLPEAIRPLARRNAVRLTHERFRADTQGLIKALQQSLDEIEALRKAEEEAARRAQAEEEERRKKAEIEARERAAEERRRQESAARQRAEEERAFTAAKRVGTVATIDAFLAAHPESGLVDEAQKLKVALLAREETYRHAMASDDSALLKSFVEIYQKGADADQVRTRLRRLEPKQSAQLSAQTIIIPGVLALMFVAGFVVWFETRPNANTQQVSAVSVPPVPTTLAATSAAQPAIPAQSAPVLSPAARPAPNPPPETQAKVANAESAPRPDEVAWSLLKDTTDDAALERFTVQFSDSPLRKDAEARIAALEAAQAAKPAPPKPDEATWAWLKDTTDEAALKRFTAQYPDSTLHKQAEARIAALAAAQAAKPVPPSSEEVTWTLLKETTDEAALKRFTAQYPKSPLRKDAEARIAALEAAPRDAGASPSDPHELARSLQFELKRVGCFNGAVNGEFDDATKAAWHKFAKQASIALPDDLSSDAIKSVRAIDKRICPLVCPDGQRPDGERCVAIAPPDNAKSRKTTTGQPTPPVDSKDTVQFKNAQGTWVTIPRSHNFAQCARNARSMGYSDSVVAQNCGSTGYIGPSQHH
jgi:hypothetical protein